MNKTGTPLIGDWRHRDGMKRAHLFAARGVREHEIDYMGRKPMCGARIKRRDAVPSRRLTTMSQDLCHDCIIAEIRRLTTCDSPHKPTIS